MPTTELDMKASIVLLTISMVLDSATIPWAEFPEDWMATFSAFSNLKVLF